jgi:hypothetical protein
VAFVPSKKDHSGSRSIRRPSTLSGRHMPGKVLDVAPFLPPTLDLRTTVLSKIPERRERRTPSWRTSSGSFNTQTRHRIHVEEKAECQNPNTWWNLNSIPHSSPELVAVRRSVQGCHTDLLTATLLQEVDGTPRIVWWPTTPAGCMLSKLSHQLLARIFTSF